MSFGTNDTINNGTYYPSPHGTVDGNSPAARQQKAERLDMSAKHRFSTVYSLDAVMNGSRGDEKHEQHRTMNGREQVSASETAPKGKYGNTPSNSIAAHQTPPWGVSVRA